MRSVHIGVLLIILLIAACSPDEDASVVLPTRIDVNAVATQNAQETQAVITPTRDPEALGENRPTLPATWTVTPSPTSTVVPSTRTPEVIDTGRIFYVYNGDSIISMNGDGTESEFILTFGVGILIEDMVISPDRSLLAFVGPGNGSAREVWVSNLDGTFTQQVSCVGYQAVRDITWSPDSRSVAFFALPASGAIAEVFTATIEGSGNCPTDNGQRQLFSTETAVPGDLIWGANGESIFYSLQGTREYTLSSGVLSEPRTQTQGLGPDFGYAFNPTNPAELAYIRRSGVLGLEQDPFGVGFRVDVTLETLDVTSVFPLPGELVDLHWLSDGNSMVLSGEGTISLYDINSNAASPIIGGLALLPMARFNELTDEAIYIGADPELPATEQVFSVTRRGRVTQLTAHPEGTVDDLIWIP